MIIAHRGFQDTEFSVPRAAFEEKGLNIRYLAFRVEDLAAAMAGVKALNLLGLSVTIPHKLEVMRHVDPSSECITTL